jgi:hypothetical protein
MRFGLLKFGLLPQKYTEFLKLYGSHLKREIKMVSLATNKA